MLAAAAILAASDVPAAPVLAVMAVGVVIALAGHAMRSNGVVMLGLTLLFLATAAMVVGGFIAFQDDPSDPRPRTSLAD